jgi:hypothetical protein
VTGGLLAAIVLAAGTAAADPSAGIETIVDGVYLRDSTQRAKIEDVTMSVESYSRKLAGDGTVKEEKRFLKTDYLKDTLFRVDFHEFYLDGIRQDSVALLKEVKADADRRRKGRNRDANINPLVAFYPAGRSHYEFTMKGTETREGRTCYHVAADCRVERDSLLEGDFWFETEGLNLVFVQFHPAKLPGPLKQLDMEIWYTPDTDGRWLPAKFHLLGRGRVMLFVTFNFAVDERYYDHRVNTGLADDFFKESANEE